MTLLVGMQLSILVKMNADGLEGFDGFRAFNYRKIKYVHRDQLDCYGSDEMNDSSPHFRSRYRFKEKTVKCLAELFRDEIGPKANTNKAFSAEQRMCLALRFLATGSFQKLLGDSEGACQATIHNHVMKVITAMSNHANQFIRFSLDEEVLQDTESGFYGFSGKFPHVAGCVGGTFIPIYSAYKNPEQFINRHAHFSLNCQIVVNHRGAITHLSSRWPGSLHDIRVFQESHMQEVMDLGLLGHRYLLGDSGYQLQANLMTPYVQPDTDEKDYYNTCLSKTRCKVECVIGMLKKKFPCLATPIHYQPTEVCHIVKACGFLWNFGLLTGDNAGYNPDEFVVEDGEMLKRELESTTGGVVRRNTLCRYLWAHKN